MSESPKKKLSLGSVALLASAPVAALLAIVVTRPYDGALFHYARTGSDWSHHQIRVWMALELPRVRFGGFLNWLTEGDHDFPPLIHAIGAPAGYLVGHGEAAVSRLGVLWVLLLALAVGSTVSSLTDSKRAGIAAFVATVLLPPFHAASLNYYFDLPMTALVWTSIAILIGLQDRRPILAGLLAGGFFFLSGLAKWSALPMAPPVLLGILLCSRPGSAPLLQQWKGRLLCATAMGLSTLGLLAGYWKLSTRSWNRMMHMTYGTDLDPSSEFLHSSTAMDAVGGILSGLPTLFDPSRHLDAEPFAFYSIRGVFCFLSPPLAVVLFALLAVWLWRSRSAWPLLAVTLMGYLVLFTVVIPTLDERFLLTPGPVLLVLMVLGWRTLPKPVAAVTAIAYIAIALWVAWDFHHGAVDNDPGVGGDASTQPTGEFSRIWAEVSGMRQGIGLQSASDAQWAWMRRDQPQPTYLALRELLWKELTACGAKVLLVEDQLTRTGLNEGLWWAYRNDLSRLRGATAFHSIQGFSDSISNIFIGDSVEPEDAIAEDQIVAISSYDLGDPGIPAGAPGIIHTGWQLRAVIDRREAEGTSHLAIWTPEGSARCPQWQHQVGELGTMEAP